MSHTTHVPPIAPSQVHEVLGRTMLADGFDMVLDLDKSQGRRLWDARGGRWILDMFSCFATLPVGLNHPRLKDPEFLARLQRAALANPTNSDIYTVEMAGFVDTFARIAQPAYLPHAFFVAGGALGIENALKAAFDWKVRRNFRAGVREERGHQVVHFREAFHGRTGYTLSLTNTADPRKHQYFAKFDWPRIDNPKLRFPVDAAETARVAQAEAAALAQVKAAFRERGDDIACVIIEPIQAEGGDNHFRPEFLRALCDLTHENDAMFIVDEVQSGVGLTGRMWAHQHFGFEPDMVAFGKKMQVCGMMVGPRIDDEPENVFKVSSRLNSTWGGNLVDMVRAQRYLEIIEEEKLVEHAGRVGQYLLKGLEALVAWRPDVLSNPRGLGLMCAIEFASPALRDAVQEQAYQDGLMILGCGPASLRFRPPLDTTAGEVDEALAFIKKAVEQTPKP